MDQCYLDHDAGTTASGNFVTCRETKCAPNCADLACVGAVTWNTPADATYDIALTIYELQSGNNLPGLSVKACAVSDTTCAAPLGEAVTDAQGVATLTVPSAVEGLGAYFEITGADVMSTLTYIHLADNATSFQAGEFWVPVMSTTTASLLTTVMQVTLDPTRGHVLFQVKDCSTYAFANGSVAVDLADAQSTTAYIKGTLPSTTATTTDTSGRGAVMNIPAGTATVTGTLEPAGTPFSSTAVTVRAGFMTSLNVVPTP